MEQNSSQESGKDALEVSCSCGVSGQVLVADVSDYKTVCPACGKVILGVSCKKCQSGFAFPEDSGEIDAANSQWKCQVCGEVNGYDIQSMQTLPFSCAPSESSLQEGGKEKKRVILIWLIFGLIAIAYLIFKFR